MGTDKTHLDEPRGGAVAIIQRFGGALNLNVHIHALVLDGVFARDGAGLIAFHPARRLTTPDVAEVLAAVEPRIRRRLDGGGLPGGDDGGHAEDCGIDPWADEAPALAGLAAASVQGITALGRRPGTRLRRLGHPREPVETPLGDCHARWKGWDLHAGLVVPAGQRERLERVCRYALRPPVPPDRLAATADGQVRLALRHPWADGTTHVVFDPVEFLGRLAVLVPRPRVNLILYYGVLGARAAWRPQVVPRRTSGPDPATGDHVDEACAAATPDTARRRARGEGWAALMRRTFGFDVLACPQCGGCLRLIAHRRGCGHRSNAPASRSSYGPARRSPRACTAAARRGGRGAGRRVRIGPLSDAYLAVNLPEVCPIPRPGVSTA